MDIQCCIYSRVLCLTHIEQEFMVCPSDRGTSQTLQRPTQTRKDTAPMRITCSHHGIGHIYFSTRHVPCCPVFSYKPIVLFF